MLLAFFSNYEKKNENKGTQMANKHTEKMPNVISIQQY